MKVVLVSMSLQGGAGGSARRLHDGLRSLGIDSTVLVRYKHDDDRDVLLVRDPMGVKWLRRISGLFRQDLEQLPLKLYQKRTPAKLFSTQWVPDAVAKKVREMKPDIVNLRWIGGQVRIESLPAFHRPIVWTLSDMWPFTGGCYIPQDCERYKDRCGACPHLGSQRDHDLSRWVWQRKFRAWRGLDLTVVTPSRWLAEKARSSGLFAGKRVEIIPSAVDTERYKPIDRAEARKILGLPLDRKLVLFAAWRNHVHKGFHLLVPALQALAQAGWGTKMDLVVFGFPRPADMPEIGIRSHFLGRFDDALAKSIVYSAVDVFAAPSTQDNFANTVLEAIACGTPCVAFGIGGMPDLIEHEGNGYIAQPFDTQDLARGIAWVVQDGARHAALSRRAREKATAEYTLGTYAQRYSGLFDELLRQRTRGH